MKHIRRPGDLVTCACEGCSKTFPLKHRGMHKMFCSKRCRDMAARLKFGLRAEADRRSRKLSDAAGGTRSDGAMISGTLTLARREVIDLDHIPQDRPELWV